MFNVLVLDFQEILGTLLGKDIKGTHVKNKKHIYIVNCKVMVQLNMYIQHQPNYTTNPDSHLWHNLQKVFALQHYSKKYYYIVL